MWKTHRSNARTGILWTMNSKEWVETMMGVIALLTLVFFFPSGVFWIAYFLIRFPEKYDKNKSGK
jgi:hypothetical protein